MPQLPMLLAVSLTVASSAATQPAEKNVVLHAAGAVELRVPGDWSVLDVPWRRAIRLELVPAGQGSAAGAGKMWLSYHARTNREDSPDTFLRELMPGRMRLAAGDEATLGRVQPLRIDRWPALRQEFTRTESERRSDERQVQEFAGFHLLVRTDWGWCEVHADVPGEMRDQLVRFEGVAESLRLSQPQQRPTAIERSVRDARPIIGSWKAYRSGMRLSGNGRISIVRDSTRLIAARSQPSGGSRHSRKITGRFVARGDLLLVTWDDGSRLNFRWRLDGDQLLLTDHDGKISLLKRIFEF